MNLAMKHPIFIQEDVMDQGSQLSSVNQQHSRGFSLAEVLMAMAVLGILMTIAIPATGAWMENAEYRKTAWDLLSVLREGRSRAVTLNREHRVAFDHAHNRYRLLQGDRGTNSSRWDTVVNAWVSPPHSVRIDPNITYIHLNTNGTANGGSIDIRDADLRTRYEVRIARTGRFRIIKK